MLYRFDPDGLHLDALVPVDAASVGISEKHIESAVAQDPTAIFAGARDKPVLVLRTSVQGRKMPDIIALDAEGRLVLVECKRGWADRDALSQLLDYASEYQKNGLGLLNRDWEYGRGRGSGQELIDAFREFADDPGFAEERLGGEQVLVVVASGQTSGFRKIADYLEGRGVPVYVCDVRLYRRGNGDLYLDVEPIELAPADKLVHGEGQAQTWLINTDETHSPGAWRRFLQHGVAGIWGFPNHEATLAKGARAGDAIYAYLNQRGLVARGKVVNGEVLNVTESTASVFPECKDDNEWHLSVEWMPLADGGAVANREVREATGTGLPFRNTFCRLLSPSVRGYLDSRWARDPA